MAESEKSTAATNGAGAKGKGGKKGGARFPRIALKKALEYSKKLVSKTAVSPQTESTILAGVVNNAGPQGQIRIAALKQFGLLQGTTQAYSATQLAKDIDTAADDNEKTPLYRRSALTPKIFQELFNTYQGDQASRAKVRGRAQNLGVHPDFSENCADLFIESAVTASLGVAEGDGIRLIHAADIGAVAANESNDQDADESEMEETTDASLASGASAEEQDANPDLDGDPGTTTIKTRKAKAEITLNLTVDSGTDGDKLEKQLTLLRRFGLI